MDLEFCVHIFQNTTTDTQFTTQATHASKVMSNFSLSSLIRESPNPTDHIKSTNAFHSARAELDIRKRARNQRSSKKAVAKARKEGLRYIQAYRRPSRFRKADIIPRTYFCSSWKLLSLDNINWMKAHSIEHIIMIDEGDIPLPMWWGDTCMTLDQFDTLGDEAYACGAMLCKENPDNCVLFASYE